MGLTGNRVGLFTIAEVSQHKRYRGRVEKVSKQLVRVETTMVNFNTRMATEKVIDFDAKSCPAWGNSSTFSLPQPGQQSRVEPRCPSHSCFLVLRSCLDGRGTFSISEKCCQRPWGWRPLKITRPLSCPRRRFASALKMDSERATQ